MITELSGLRMALDEYDHAEGHHSQREAEKRVHRLATIGILKIMIAAIDDPNRPGAAPPVEP